MTSMKHRHLVILNSIEDPQASDRELERNSLKLKAFAALTWIPDRVGDDDAEN